MVAHPSVATGWGNTVLKYAFCAMSVTGKALITGGAGFIGSHLAELLLSDGREIWALDDLSTGSIQNVEHLREAARTLAKYHRIVASFGLLPPRSREPFLSETLRGRKHQHQSPARNPARHKG